MTSAEELEAIARRGPGARRGALIGRSATGAVIDFQGVEIIRIANGRVAERRGERTGLSIAGQLDAVAAG